MEDLITLGTSGLDRAAELRGNEAALAQLLNGPNSSVLAVWRGKPLMMESQLVWLAADHAMFDEADEAPVFLGRDDGIARFARDISGIGWTENRQKSSKNYVWGDF